MVRVLERIEGHYDAFEVPFGKVYRWCPEVVIVECGCGKVLALKGTAGTRCEGCGDDLSEVVGGPCVSAEPPWSEHCEEWLRERTLHPHSEQTEWMELVALD